MSINIRILASNAYKKVIYITYIYLILKKIQGSNLVISNLRRIEKNKEKHVICIKIKIYTYCKDSFFKFCKNEKKNFIRPK